MDLKFSSIRLLADDLLLVDQLKPLIGCSKVYAKLFGVVRMKDTMTFWIIYNPVFMTQLCEVYEGASVELRKLYNSALRTLSILSLQHLLS